MKTKTNKVLKSVIALVLMLLMACSVTVPTLAAGYESTRYKASPYFTHMKIVFRYMCMSFITARVRCARNQKFITRTIPDRKSIR